jgi:hypothetical protein
MKKYITILVLSICGLCQAGEDPIPMPYNILKYKLIENTFQNMDSINVAEKKEKSVFLAALFSAMIPGAGQLYSGSLWKSILFAGIELAGWTTYLLHNSKGNQQEDDMQQFAHEHWSEHKYWSWLYYNGGLSDYVKNLAEYQNLDYATYVDENNNIWLVQYNEEVVNQLRFLEEALGHTHRLPETKTQQYYEMIYKYLTQFGNAWDDADFYQTYYGNTNIMTPNMKSYRDIRNDMNRFFDIAATATNIILINHVLSALDAAWTARGYNRTLNLKLRVVNKNYLDERVQMYGIYLSW